MLCKYIFLLQTDNENNVSFVNIDGVALNNLCWSILLSIQG